MMKEPVKAKSAIDSHEVLGLLTLLYSALKSIPTSTKFSIDAGPNRLCIMADVSSIVLLFERTRMDTPWDLWVYPGLFSAKFPHEEVMELMENHLTGYLKKY